MDTLQKIIGEMEDDFLRAYQISQNEKASVWLRIRKREFAYALKKYVPKLKLLLSDKPTVAITEAAHSANTMLSEVPTSESDTHIGVSGADSSETEIVKQNEQTKEVCLTCKFNSKAKAEWPCVDCCMYDRWEAN